MELPVAAYFEFHLHINGPQGRSVFILPVGATTVGRNPGNQILLVDNKVSRLHARFDCTESECRLTDLGSGNGTYVDGRRLIPDAPEPVAETSQIQIGPYQLKLEPIFVDASGPQAGPPEPAAEGGDGKEVDFSPPAGMPAQGPEEKREHPPAGLPEVEPPPISTFGVNGTGSEQAEIVAGFIPDGRFLLSYLPGIYHTEFMEKFLAIFEAVLLPIAWTIDNFDLYLSPGTAPQGFLGWLSGWWDLTFSPGWSEAQRRMMLQEAHRIYERRGTRWALSRVLEIYTGSSPEIDDTSKDLKPFVFRVKVKRPQDDPDREQIEALIDAHKPAHTSYILEMT